MTSLCFWWVLTWYHSFCSPLSMKTRPAEHGPFLCSCSISTSPSCHVCLVASGGVLEQRTVWNGSFNQNFWLGHTDPAIGGFGLFPQNYFQWLFCRVVVWSVDWKTLKDRVLILIIPFGNLLVENRPAWFLVTLGADSIAKWATLKVLAIQPK